LRRFLELSGDGRGCGIAFAHAIGTGDPMKTNHMTPFAALLALCVAAPAFAQTQTQTQTPAPTSAQPQTPTQTQPPTTAQPQAPTQTQPATTAQPMTPQPATQVSTPTPVGTTGTSPVADKDHGTEILLLDRVQKVLDKAADDAKGSAVTIDRGLLDELRAEVTQVKTSLQAQKP
jgi:glucose/arabinose dehydrogenase